MKKVVVGVLLLGSLLFASCNDTTGYTCSEPDESSTCERTDEAMIYCIKNDLSDSYYKVGSKKFPCGSGTQDCAQEVAEYCTESQ